MPTRVQLPDGSIGEFPDGMPDSAIEAVLQKQYGGPQTTPDRPAGLPAGVNLPQPAAHPAVRMSAPSTASSRLLGSGNTSDTLGVVGSHLKNLVAGPYHAFTDAPKNAQEAGEKGTVPGLGQFGLGMARMFVNPTLDAGKSAVTNLKAGNYAAAANDAMDAIPVAGPWARSIENEAQEKGALPALLGAGVDAFAPDAVGGVLGKIREAAPSMAEGAMNIRRGDRGYGKTPGRAILDETTGVRPETVGAQAQAKLSSLTPTLDAMAAQHTGMIDTSPAIDHVQGDIDTAAARNNRSGMDSLAPVKGALTTNAVTGLGLSPLQSATGVLNLKRGLRDQFVRNWSPDAASILTRDTAKGASGVLDTSLDSALGPKFAQTNQRISSLIPVADAAEKLSRADELPQKFGDKLKAHTGALTSAIAGGLAGASHGGAPGGLFGAGLGFALPELIASPTSRLIMARGMDSGIPSATLRPLLTGGMVSPKKR